MDRQNDAWNGSDNVTRWRDPWSAAFISWVLCHCDIVVAVDETHSRILAIGGNVQGTVGMKILPALRRADGTLYPVAQPPGSGTRVLFAHLRLAFDPVDADALSGTPTMQTMMVCSGEASPPAQLFAFGLVELLSVNARC